jgi:hypothetical protein
MKFGALLKWGIFNKGTIIERVAKEVCSETFLQRRREAESSYKKLNEITQKVYFNFLSRSASSSGWTQTLHLRLMSRVFYHSAKFFSLQELFFLFQFFCHLTIEVDNWFVCSTLKLQKYNSWPNFISYIKLFE